MKTKKYFCYLKQKDNFYIKDKLNFYVDIYFEK